jgi:hypothetical protein
MTNFIITLITALIFGFIALRLKVPAGALLGSVVGIIILNSFTEMALFPDEIKIFSTSLIGAYVGCNVTREDIRQMRIIAKPVAVMVLIMFSYNMISSILLTKTSGLDFTTAFLAMSPAGIADMSLIALEMGANAPAVTTIQMMRLIAVITLCPFVIKGNISFFRKRGYVESLLVEPVKEDSKEISLGESGKYKNVKKIKRNKLAVTIFIAIITGIIGKISGFPAGNLLFPMCAIIAVNLSKEYAYMPTSIRRFAQMLSGALIGIQFSLKDLLMIWDSIVPVFMAVIGWIIINQIMGVIINRWAKIPLTTALFSSAPGGLTDMGIIAAELGGNSAVITSFQFARVLSVVMFYPILIHFIVGLGIV